MINANQLLLLLCLLRLKLSKTSTLPQLYYRLASKSKVEVKCLRKLEKLGLEVAKLKLDVKYLEDCDDLNICPKFLKVNPKKLLAYNNDEAINKAVVRRQLYEIRLKMNQKSEKYKKDFDIIASQLGRLDGSVLKYYLERAYDDMKEKQRETHEKKLFKLWREDRFHSPDCLINLSAAKLNIHEENVLRCGLKHHILPKRFNFEQIKVGIEKLIYTAKRITGIEPDNEFTENLKYHVNQFCRKAKHCCSQKMNRYFHSTLSKLSKRDDIKICSSDKSNGIAILDSKSYFEKMDSIVLDESKFKEVHVDSRNDLKYHPVIKREKKLREYLKKNLKPYIEEEQFSALLPTGSKPGKIYGKCKTHKPNYPLRPVVSMISTAEYELAKYLDSIIKPNMPSTYTVNSTDSFMEKLATKNICSDNYMVSFDVKSLFTNIPLTETINIITEVIYKQGAKYTPNFPKVIFKKLLLFATDGMFMYNNKLYKQVDGVAMGSPLGSSLANFFLGYYEDILFQSLPNNCPVPITYIRYVDDIFAVFNDRSYDAFFKALNSMHPNLSFTVEEMKPTLSLPFLDTQITLTKEGYFSTIYRKITNSNVFLNFNANAPVAWKRGLVFGMLKRASSICSSKSLLQNEVQKIKHIFQENNYPSDFLNKIVSSFFI